ncbi:MAG: hypothetical protein KAW47_07310 [Thermoplasmatales archaeon]|nr:hypothetical protein [Thermoplasmatales archaeon]
MNKKIFAIGICLLFLAMFLPQVAADDSTPMQTEQSLKFSCKLFLRCYIESTTPGSYEDPGRYPNFGIGLYCLYGGNSKTTVYNEKNGEIIWEHEGLHQIWFTFFNGYTEKTEDMSTMSGNAMGVFLLGI